jgi:hypothetical protein
MATLLSRLGLTVGHEVVFGPRSRGFNGFQGMQGDCSWLAAPFLAELPPDSVVIHQVRHPLAVTRSLVGIRFFDDRSRAFLAADDVYTRAKWQVRRGLMARGHVERSTKGPRPHHVYRGFVAAEAPQLLDDPDPVVRCVRYWWWWNELVERSAQQAGLEYVRHHLEDVGPDQLAFELVRIGLPVTADHVALVVDGLTQDVNAQRRAKLAWNNVPLGPDRKRAEALAARYGYTPDRPELPRSPETA